MLQIFQCQLPSLCSVRVFITQNNGYGKKYSKPQANIEIFSIQNATWVRLKPTILESLIATHRATHLCHEGWRPSSGKNWLGFNLMQLNYWPCVIVCVGFGLSVGKRQQQQNTNQYMYLATRLWVQVQLQPNILFCFNA